MSSPTSRPRRRIRVLKLSSYLPRIGGGELQTHAVSRALRASGVQVRVVDLRGQGGPPCARLDGIPVLRYRTPGRPGVDPIWVQGRLWRLLGRLRHRHDVLQVNHLGAPLLAAMAHARLRRVPLVLVLWGSCRPGIGPFRKSLPWAALRLLARRADRIVALSRVMADNLVEVWGFPQDRIRVIPNGVDIDRFGPQAGAPPADLPPHRPLVVALGRLVPAKRYDLLLDAWSRVARDHPAAHLVLLGDGRLRAALQQQIADLDLAAQVTLAGARRDVPGWLAAGDVFVSSSDTEGMSNAVLEAMASGLPLVVTGVSGSEELVEDGVHGLSVPPGDAAALAQALSRLLGEPALRKTMGSAARRKIEENYALPAIARRYRELYEEVLGPAGSHDA